jgi:hypothetical protein
MGRFRQPAGRKGSLRWIQKLVNEHANVLDGAIGLGPIDWRSPRADDDFAEYRDEAFLDKLGVTLPKVALPRFWPARGPQWDALGRAQSGQVILVEAKAHVSEIMSSGSQASPDSLAKIRKALTATASALRAEPGLDWAVRFYQYTNRLAHAHLLHTLNRVPARLVFVYFVGDPDLDGPTSKREWVAAINVLHEALGIRARVPSYVVDVFVDIRTQTPTLV